MKWPIAAIEIGIEVEDHREGDGLLAALPFVFGAVGMVLLGRHSDRTMERKVTSPQHF